MKVNIVYIAKNIINNKEYIGRTNKKLNKRITDGHAKAIENGSNTKFHNAIRKYGKKNFKWSILKTCQSWEEAGIMETFMIMVHHTHWTEGGYNMTWGNDGQSPDWFENYPNKEILREKYRQATIRRYENPEERIRTCEDTKKGYTQEVRQIMSNFQSQRYKNTDERKKQSERLIKYNSDPNVRKVKSEKMKISWEKDTERREKYSKENKNRLLSIAGNCKGTIWYYNDMLGISKRFFPDNVPKGWLLGRRKHVN